MYVLALGGQVCFALIPGLSMHQGNICVPMCINEGWGKILCLRCSSCFLLVFDFGRLVFRSHCERAVALLFAGRL